MNRFAVFDIDGTVIRWQLFHAIVGELARRKQLSPAAAGKIHEARMTWKRRDGEDSFKAYEHTLLDVYLEALSGMSVVQYQAAVENVFEEYKDQTYTYTRDLIRTLKEQGYLLFAISGSQQEIVNKFAAYYGFDDAIGTHLEQLNGTFTGKSETPVQGKGAFLEKLLSRHDTSHDGSIAIGDSESDIPLLEAVERPIAFNPNAGLLKTAQARGWNVVLERKNVVYELRNHDGTYLLA
ncbi:MAG: HAD family hydrolase [Candidatus Saccharimonadales bacterium]